mmetsp:Transcript_73607/g.204579  ORF Transcript_73607/g.204579 Transcript_73607/m.204579 type:complete len:420 (-) Transcript_73607:88-1347(-)
MAPNLADARYGATLCGGLTASAATLAALRKLAAGPARGDALVEAGGLTCSPAGGTLQKTPKSLTLLVGRANAGTAVAAQSSPSMQPHADADGALPPPELGRSSSAPALGWASSAARANGRAANLRRDASAPGWSKVGGIKHADRPRRYPRPHKVCSASSAGRFAGQRRTSDATDRAAKGTLRMPAEWKERPRLDVDKRGLSASELFYEISRSEQTFGQILGEVKIAYEKFLRDRGASVPTGCIAAKWGVSAPSAAELVVDVARKSWPLGQDQTTARCGARRCQELELENTALKALVRRLRAELAQAPSTTVAAPPANLATRVGLEAGGARVAASRGVVEGAAADVVRMDLEVSRGSTPTLSRSSSLGLRNPQPSMRPAASPERPAGVPALDMGRLHGSLDADNCSSCSTSSSQMVGSDL